MADLSYDELHSETRQLFLKVFDLMRQTDPSISLSVTTSLFLVALETMTDGGNAEGMRMAKMHAAIMSEMLSNAAKATTPKEFRESVQAGVTLQNMVARGKGKVS